MGISNFAAISVWVSSPKCWSRINSRSCSGKLSTACRTSQTSDSWSADGAAIANTGSDKVLLVDADSKPRSISPQLGLAERRGFLDLVADPRLSPASVVLQSAIPSLSILPIGSRQAWEANSSPSITPTIERLGRTYPNHLVILDAPPCLSTSDPHTIAAHVGQVVMVVEAERTQRSEVEAALDLVRVCPNITVLLNKVKLTSSNTFGAYDYYGSYT